MRQQRIITVPHPTHPGKEEDWLVEEEYPMEDYNEYTDSYTNNIYNDMNDPQQLLFGAGGIKRPREDDLNDKDPLYHIGDKDDDKGKEEDDDDRDDAIDLTDPTGMKKDNNAPEYAPSAPKVAVAPYFKMHTTVSAPISPVMQLQRYINRRAVETLLPFRDFVADITAVMTMYDSDMFYRNGKTSDNLWLIRNYKGNRDEYDILRHNAGHLSKELILVWMGEWWKDHNSNTIATLTQHDDVVEKDTLESNLSAFRSQLIGANNAPTIFQHARQMRQNLPHIVPAASNIIVTPPWHFNLLNVDIVKDMILSDVGKGTLRVALELLQGHIFGANSWTLSMILSSPVVRVYFAGWTKTLITKNNANGYPGRVYVGGNSRSGGSMAINLSSGVTYLKMQAHVLRGFRKLFRDVSTRQHSRVTEMENEVRQLETRVSNSSGATQTRLVNQLNDAREQLDELRVRLPRELVMPLANTMVYN